MSVFLLGLLVVALATRECRDKTSEVLYVRT
jgi:hypothetical protein